MNAMQSDLYMPEDLIADLGPLLLQFLPIAILPLFMIVGFRAFRTLFMYESRPARKPVKVSEPMKALPTRTERQKAIAEIEAEHLKVTDKRTCKCAYCLGSVKPVSLTPPTVEDWEGWEHYGLLAPKAGAR